MITYGYFNSSGGDRVYNADQMSEYFDGLITNGVYEDVGNALVVAAGEGMTVTVGSGRAIIDCKWLKNDAMLTVDITPANALLPRYTAVIVHLDTTNRLMEITTKDGTAASTPVQPTIDDTELCLAMIYIGAGVTSIAQANITDTRADTSICGWITGLIEQVDTSTLWQQWQDAYSTYFEEMTASFDEWMSSLTNQLNVNTYIANYRKQATLAGESTTIDLDMTGYTYDASDVILVFINGLLGTADTDYSIDSSTGAITPTATASGTVIDIVVLKSKIGFNILASSLGAALVTSQGNGIITT